MTVASQNDDNLMVFKIIGKPFFFFSQIRGIFFLLSDKWDIFSSSATAFVF